MKQWKTDPFKKLLNLYWTFQEEEEKVWTSSDKQDFQLAGLSSGEKPAGFSPPKPVDGKI